MYLTMRFKYNQKKKKLVKYIVCYSVYTVKIKLEKK